MSEEIELLKQILLSLAVIGCILGLLTGFKIGEYFKK